jgi:4-diphosphocytidyl-2-C-methyl-D-erythritol kinase
MHLDTDRLRLLAKRLGADCPFFIEHRPAYVTGIGDCIEPLAVDPIAGHRLVVVKPPDAVSTAEAYAGITPRQPAESLRDILALPVEQWQGRLVNDFERSVFPAHPEIPALKEEFYRRGALYAAMSGSGSAVFALFPANV